MPPSDSLLPRLAAAPLVRAAQVLPVVVVTGARQTGKSTLVRLATAGADGAPPTHAYLTLDIPATLGLARADADAFVRQADTLVIDEVQRAPDLLLAIKAAVDADHPRRPGRFLLTGSANLVLLKRVRESLAGRAAYVTLHPLTRREQLGFGASGIWSELLNTEPRRWRDLVLDQSVPDEDWRELALRGGYPPAAYELGDAEARTIWFDGYVRSYFERDVPEILAVESLPAFDTVLRSLALRVGTLVNVTQLARNAAIPQTTAQRYVAVLEASYQLHRVPAYVRSKVRQLVKSPKYYWSDVGLAMFLGREREPRGEHLENLVAHDLLAWCDAQVPAPGIFFWRTAKGVEVDFVIESGAQLLPVEVKATRQPSTREIAPLHTFLTEYSDRALAGLVLHTGGETFWIARNILAVPWWRIV